MTYKRIRNDDFMLICNYGSCSFTEHFDSIEEPVKKGWRLTEDGHVCPLCMEKRNEKRTRNISTSHERYVKKKIKSIRLTEEFYKKVEAFIEKYNGRREMRYSWNKLRFGKLVRDALEDFMKKKEEEWDPEKKI